MLSEVPQRRQHWRKLRLEISKKKGKRKQVFENVWCTIKVLKRKFARNKQEDLKLLVSMNLIQLILLKSRGKISEIFHPSY